MEEMNKKNNKTYAAMKAGMDRRTASKYWELGKLPSELPPVERDWRTRDDPFAEDWPAFPPDTVSEEDADLVAEEPSAPVGPEMVSEPAVIKETTVGGLVRAPSGDLQRTYGKDEKAPVACPT